MSNLHEKLHNIIGAAIEKAQNLHYARGSAVERLEGFNFHTNGYAEPGYPDPESGVICIGNFNDITQWDNEAHQLVILSDLPNRVAKVFEERYGVELEWNDENRACDECEKIIRTEPDSFYWTPFFIQRGREFLCKNCAQSVGDGESTPTGTPNAASRMPR